MWGLDGQSLRLFLCTFCSVIIYIYHRRLSEGFETWNPFPNTGLLMQMKYTSFSLTPLVSECINVSYVLLHFLYKTKYDAQNYKYCFVDAKLPLIRSQSAEDDTWRKWDEQIGQLTRITQYVTCVMSKPTTLSSESTVLHPTPKETCCILEWTISWICEEWVETNRDGFLRYCHGNGRHHA
jgi:hypothetical protein